MLHHFNKKQRISTINRRLSKIDYSIEYKEPAFDGAPRSYQIYEIIDDEKIPVIYFYKKSEAIESLNIFLNYGVFKTNPVSR